MVSHQTSDRLWDFTSVNHELSGLSPFPQSRGKPWDLTYNTSRLGDIFSATSKPAVPSSDTTNAVRESIFRDLGASLSGKPDRAPTGLGDFSRVYSFLGTPQPSPSLREQPDSNNAAIIAHLPLGLEPQVEDHRDLPPAKASPHDSHRELHVSVESGDDFTADDTANETSRTDPTHLTKNQRKKQRRKERKALEPAEAEEASTSTKPTATENKQNHHELQKQATPQANVSAKRLTSRPVDQQSNTATSPAATAGRIAWLRRAALPKENASPHVSQDAPYGSLPGTPTPKHSTPSQCATVASGTMTKPHLLPFTVQPPTKSAAPFPPSKSARQQVTPSPPLQDLIAQQSEIMKRSQQPPRQEPSKPVAPSMSTPVAQRVQQTSLRTPHTVQQPTQASPQQFQPQVVPQSAPSRPARPKIEPTKSRLAEDRHQKLLMDLVHHFPNDKKYLFNPMNLTTHNNSPAGIHVFVDASNIFIGFTEQLKRLRNIPPYVHVEPAEISFDALALLMERRRPVAKRYLAGSLPRTTAFDRAEQVGYQCHLLDKVWKAKELTARQIYFNEQEQARKYGNNGNCSRGKAAKAQAPPAAPTNGYGSGSETTPAANTAPQYAKAKWVEQGVDEMLHLQMLQSIIDVEQPATMVLATGDAAQAEYSDGFMAMAERALNKGWTVELVTWAWNVNGLYKNAGFRRKWGERFRIVELDAFAEELLDL